MPNQEDLEKVERKTEDGKETVECIPPHDLAKENDAQVVVALMSGRSCGCDFSPEQTIRQLKEEAQRKLGVVIKSLIGPNTEPLNEEKTLEEENILPGSSLTVVAVDQEEEDEREAKENQCHDIFAAVWGGHLGAVRHLLRTQPDAVRARWRSSTGAGPLCHAAAQGRGEICRVLLAAQADVAARDERGCTPLHHAISDNYVEIVKLLLEWKASNVKDNNGQTPLNLAAGKGHTEICSILVAADVDVNVTGHNGSTPLHDAALGGHADVVKLLLEGKARVILINNDRMTALHLAASGGHADAVKLLLEAKSPVMSKDREGQTPLDVARNQGQHEVATLLDQCGTDLSGR
eukprot:s331_g11.t1